MGPWNVIFHRPSPAIWLSLAQREIPAWPSTLPKVFPLSCMPSIRPRRAAWVARTVGPGRHSRVESRWPQKRPGNQFLSWLEMAVSPLALRGFKALKRSLRRLPALNLTTSAAVTDQDGNQTGSWHMAKEKKSVREVVWEWKSHGGTEEKRFRRFLYLFLTFFFFLRLLSSGLDQRQVAEETTSGCLHVLSSSAAGHAVPCIVEYWHVVLAVWFC